MCEYMFIKCWKTCVHKINYIFRYILKPFSFRLVKNGQAQPSSLKPQLKLSLAIYPLLPPPRKVFKAKLKPKLQLQLDDMSLIAKFSWVQHYFEFHPPPPVPVDSKVELSKASSFRQSFL